MNRFLSADEKYRKQMIEYVRESVNLPHKSIEKDLWVTQVLHALFSLPVSRGLGTCACCDGHCRKDDGGEDVPSA